MTVVIDPITIAQAALEQMPAPAKAKRRDFALVEAAADGIAQHLRVVREQTIDVSASVARGDRTLAEAREDLAYLIALRRRCRQAKQALEDYLDAHIASRSTNSAAPIPANVQEDAR